MEVLIHLGFSFSKITKMPLIAQRSWHGKFGLSRRFLGVHTRNIITWRKKQVQWEAPFYALSGFGSSEDNITTLVSKYLIQQVAREEVWRRMAEMEEEGQTNEPFACTGALFIHLSSVPHLLRLRPICSLVFSFV